MNRRLLFKQAFALFGIPSGHVGFASPVTIGLPDPNSEPVPDVGAGPPFWLEAWLRLPMQPVIAEADLGDGCDRRVRETALKLLTRSGGVAPTILRYFGGIEPGRKRSVLPVLLFRKIAADASAGETESADASAAGPLYLLAHCLTRAEARVFRLDRIELITE